MAKVQNSSTAAMGDPEETNYAIYIEPNSKPATSLEISWSNIANHSRIERKQMNIWRKAVEQVGK